MSSYARKRSMTVIARDHRVMSTSLTRDYPFVFREARGCYIWDDERKKYLDFAASIATMNTGYSNPAIINAVRKQLKRGTHCAFPDFYSEVPVRYAETLLKSMPSPFDRGRVFLSNSGTEAVECALKLAKWSRRRPYMIAFDHCFHGRTMGSLSMTNSKPVQREGFGPFLPVKHVPYPYPYRMNMTPEEASNYCLSELEKAMKRLKNKCSGLFIEPIQGEGGYIVPPKSFVRGVRKLCNEYDILMCDDEVQSGCWRTGKFLAIENFGVTPDIVSMAKAIGGGFPLGATVAKPGLMKWPPGAHSNTFGGNLVACAAGAAALEFLKKKKIGKHATKIGNYMIKRLKEMEEKYNNIGDVRGMGLMIGVEVVCSKESRKSGIAEREFILYKSFEKGLVLLPAGRSVIRICPPLTITKKQADHGLDILDHAFHMLHHKNL